MKISAVVSSVALILSSTNASNLVKREVPQEHSHELILSAARRIINQGGNSSPISKVDAVFGLLGNQAILNFLPSVAGLSEEDKVTDCIHQRLADECLTNAKKNKAPKEDLATCIQYAALERNTGGVGKVSVTCTQKAVNQELANIVQHQDAASTEAAKNKDIEINVAKAIFSLGFSAEEAADLAQRTATFSPGDLGDSTGKGNSCDVGSNGEKLVSDVDGTIFGQTFKKGDTIDCATLETLKGGKSKIVPAASLAELIAAVGGAAGNTPPPATPAKPTTTAGASPVVKPATNSVKTVTVFSTIDCSATPLAKPSAAPVATQPQPASAPAADVFAPCEEPVLKFGLGLEGRKETSFISTSKSFAHGSALNFGVIGDNICIRLRDSCKGAPAAAVCDAALAKAKSVTRGQETIDVFLAELKKAPVAAGSAAGATAVAGTQIFKFDGVFGAPMAFPVVSSGDSKRKFKVAEDTFVNFGAACHRACDKQNNACSNAVNSQKVQGSVGQCNDQQSKCFVACDAKQATL